MPDDIRARSQAGLRMGQFTAFAVISMTATIAVATHSKIAVSTAQEHLFETAGEAEQVFTTEARAAELRHELDGIQGYTRLYERLSFPLDISDVLATVVNNLPDSVSLDEIDLDAGARVLGRTARSRGVEKETEAPPRILTGEVSGFAATDQQIAELVSTLESTQPFQNVSLDFSRGRKVNDHEAREFRLSFRISLDDGYRVTHADAPGTPRTVAQIPASQPQTPRGVADANQ